ncbi:MAG: hypothetical protein FXF54_05590 [Kosmotoga sp.]|nr:MAG: hypothetical protein FXF54_05590 [Kosmotoga sp.]
MKRWKSLLLFIKIVLIIAVVIAIVAGIVYLANKSFNDQVKKEIDELFKHVSVSDKNVITQVDLENLPAPVKNWMNFAGVVGKERIVTARLKQKAEMKLEKEKSWMPVEAEQYFTVNPPGFIWKARIKAAPFFHIVGRDKYLNGKGNMQIKILSLFTVSDASGDEMDQGTLLRYLAEIVWFPSGALSNYITWEEIDNNTTKATMSFEGTTASGIFSFSDEGYVTNFEAERYKETDGEYSLETWSVNMYEYKNMHGYMIPTKGKVTWKLDDGDFTWFRFEITDIEYNKTEPY